MEARKMHRRLGLVALGALAGALCFALPTLAIAATAKAKVASKPALAPRLYDMKGVALGTTLEAFREMPHPDGDEAKVVCTGDKVLRYGKPETVSELYVEPAQLELGITKCLWWGKSQFTSEGKSIPLKVPAEGYIIGEYSFDFIRDQKDGQLRFYRFFGKSNTNAYPDTVAAMAAKFGLPKTEPENVQNGLGATFASTTSTWANPLSILTVKERWSKVTLMAIMMTDNRLLAIEAAAREARKPGI